MNPKLVYLLLGVLVKQTIDEFKAIAKQRADDLAKQQERLATYPGNPAVMAGSQAAHRIICEHEWANSVAPTLKKLARWQAVWQYVPFVVYLLLTSGVFWYAMAHPDTTP